MRAQRTAQPRRACDTTVFSCANGEVSVRSVTLSQSGSHRPVRFAVSLSRCGGQLTSFQRSSLRRVSGRSWESSIAHRRCRRKGLGSARVPTFISRAGPESPVPGPTSVHDHGRDHPSPLDARRSGAERCTVVLVALCLWICAQWRVCARRSGD